MRDQVDRDTTRMLGGSDLARRRSSGLIRAGSLLHDEMRDDDGGQPAAGTFFLLPPSVPPTTGGRVPGVLQEEDDFEERALEMEPIKKTLAGSDPLLRSAPGSPPHLQPFSTKINTRKTDSLRRPTRQQRR
jgi:hypothetical protein